MRKLTSKDKAKIEECVLHFEEHRPLFNAFASDVHDQLRDDKELAPFIHFIKFRLKSTARLRSKLLNKFTSIPKELITPENVFREINDLAGVRILHLHTTQIAEINKHITRILENAKIRIIEGPTAHCWDVEYENLFKELGIKVAKAKREKMYMSVHYILEANKRTKITIELQVRTLTEELWGEVSHRVAYEDRNPNTAILDQLGVLARISSGSTRLVDCIFRTHRDSGSRGQKNRKTTPHTHKARTEKKKPKRSGKS